MQMERSARRIALSNHVLYNGGMIGCIDGEYARDALDVVSCLAGGRRIDPYNRPGATKRHCRSCAVTQEVIDDIARITIANHGAKNLYLVHHTDCLAYGGHRAFSSRTKERAAHVLDLRTAKRLFFEEVMAYAELLLEDGDLTSWERGHLEAALRGGFKVTPILLPSVTERANRSFTPAECHALIVSG